MNVFILGTGRCGTTTFSKACGYVRGYTVGHESRWRKTGDDRLNYPGNHIEVDNRLSWYLGRLHARFNHDVLYVHLARDRAGVIESFLQRQPTALIQGWRRGVVCSISSDDDLPAMVADYVDAVLANVGLFVRDRGGLTIRIEDPIDGFAEMCDRLGADVDIDEAIETLGQRHNWTPDAVPDFTLQSEQS